MTPILLSALILIPVVIAACHGIVVWSARGRCLDRPQDLPERTAGLVLGCAPTVAGQPNRFFSHRIEAAADLFHSGKVRALIVSGDNSTPSYDEPTAMMEALVRAGVPEERIYRDFAGFRTLDSIVRAREIFSQSALIIVSQRFHNERAVFLARRNGLDAMALNARDVSGTGGWRTYVREAFARVRAVLDSLFDTPPKFLGEPVEIRPKEPRLSPAPASAPAAPARRG